MNILSNFTSNELQSINSIKSICVDCCINMYLVGGVIRDSLLQNKPKDIDICVQCDPMQIINKLKHIKRYTYHEKFNTSTILFENDVEIDLIRCRKEKYEHNGELPTITPSDIMDDLYRRDFTVNSIAYDMINKKIIDPYNGMNDIKNKVIRKIHNNSYEEDPTRIFRAIKYSNRYNFNILDKEEIRRSITKGCIGSISNDRIMREIVLLCKEDNWIKSMDTCKNYKIFDLEYRLLTKTNILCDYSEVNDRIINVFLSLTIREHKEIFIKNSILHKELRFAFIKSYEEIINSEYLNGIKDNFEIHSKLQKANIHEIKILAFYKENKYKVINYLRNLKKMVFDLNGKDLMDMGLQERKKYGDIFNYIRRIKLNTGIINEKKYIHKNLGEILNVVKYKN